MSNFNISSFFDEFEYDSKNYKLYNECTNETNINLNKKILYEGELAIKSANGLFKTRYFRLQDRKLLMFSKIDSRNPHGFFDLNTFISILMMPVYKKGNEKPLFTFRMKKFYKFYDFYSNSLETIKKWFSVLKIYCISQDFNTSYEKLELLGKGNFAKVYKVRHKKTNELFAAKIIDKNMPKINKELIYKEMKILKYLPKHENILKTYEIFEEEESIIVIMELMQGGDLYKKIRKTKNLSEVDALFYFKQMIKAVKFLHSHGVVHRDIKPENLLLSDNSENGKIKLADFSLAEFFLENKMNLQCGTPGYIAPEILNNENHEFYDESIDIFSLGVTLYMMLCGCGPFKGKEAKAILERNKIGIIKFKKKNWEKISKDARMLVLKMTAKSPEKRIPISSILIDKWIKTNFCKSLREIPKNDNKHVEDMHLSNMKLSSFYSKESEEELKVFDHKSKKSNASTMFSTMTNKHTNHKFFNSIDSIFLASCDNSSISNTYMSRESMDSLPKSSRRLLKSITEIEMKKKMSKFNIDMSPEKNHDDEITSIICQETHGISSLIQFLKEKAVCPKFNLEF